MRELSKSITAAHPERFEKICCPIVNVVNNMAPEKPATISPAKWSLTAFMDMKAKQYSICIPNGYPVNVLGTFET